MRSDMSQLMVERPRHFFSGDGPKRTHRRRLNDPRGFDDAATHESIGRHYGWKSKSLNENFAPFLRFLRSRVGHRWDDVYSEVRSCLRVDRAVDLHVVGHIKDFLCTQTWRDDDGDLVGHREWGGPFFFDRSLERWSRAPKFYVDPDGVLRATPRRRPRRVPKLAARDDVVCKDGLASIRRGGIWYALDLRRIERDDVRWGRRQRVQLLVNGVNEWHWREGDYDVVFDSWVGRVAAKDAVAFYGADNVYAERVGKQLGKRALTALGLR